MKDYEGIFILDTKLGPDVLKKATSTLSDTITKEEGTIIKTDTWGKRRLAYLIKKSYEGYYVLLRFQLNPDKITRIRSVYQLNDNLLRYLIVLYDEKTLIKPKKEKKQKPATAAVEAAAETPAAVSQ